VALLRQQLDSSVLVEFSQFIIQDHDGNHHALSLGVPEQPATRVVGGRGGLWIRSSATDHQTAVRLQLWDSEPPPPPESPWAYVGHADFSTDGARLRLWSVTAAHGDGELSLERGGAFHAQVFATPGATDAQDADHPEDADYPEDVEKWLVRMWRDDRVDGPSGDRYVRT
jgi:hypothetical protein